MYFCLWCYSEELKRAESIWKRRLPAKDCPISAGRLLGLGWKTAWSRLENRPVSGSVNLTVQSFLHAGKDVDNSLQARIFSMLFSDEPASATAEAAKYGREAVGLPWVGNQKQIKRYCRLELCSPRLNNKEEALRWRGLQKRVPHRWKLWYNIAIAHILAGSCRPQRSCFLFFMPAFRHAF